jgi:esterase/lipase
MKKKALLFIHGFAGGTYDYGELINDLELNGLFDIFSYTMKGHGNLVINKVTKDDWIKDAEYNINGEEGTIAIIGPKRMEYDRVVTLLDYIKNNLGGDYGK